jgi:hypothetical protein
MLLVRVVLQGYSTYTNAVIDETTVATLVEIFRGSQLTTEPTIIVADVGGLSMQPRMHYYYYHSRT